MTSSSDLIKAPAEPDGTQGWDPVAFGRPLCELPGGGSLPAQIPLSMAPQKMVRSGERVIKAVQDENKAQTWQPGPISSHGAGQIYPDRASAYWSNPTPEQMPAEIQEQAAEILKHAREQAAQIVYLAHQDGYKQGQEAARAEAASCLQAAQAIVQEVQAWRAAMIQQSERAVIDLTKEIARSIFGPGVTLDPEVLSKAFERGLREAKTLGKLRLHLHPDDLAVLQADWSKEQSAMTGQSLQLVADPDITRGGCLINGENGSVDARMETQLQLAFDTLSEQLPEDLGGGG